MAQGESRLMGLASRPQKPAEYLLLFPTCATLPRSRFGIGKTAGARTSSTAIPPHLRARYFLDQQLAFSAARTESILAAGSRVSPKLSRNLVHCPIRYSCLLQASLPPLTLVKRAWVLFCDIEFFLNRILWFSLLHTNLLEDAASRAFFAF